MIIPFEAARGRRSIGASEDGVSQAAGMSIVLSEVVELLSVALRAVLALAAIAFCLFSSVVQVTFIIFS